jgi:hypothetical protein
MEDLSSAQYKPEVGSVQGLSLGLVFSFSAMTVMLGRYHICPQYCYIVHCRHTANWPIREDFPWQKCWLVYLKFSILQLQQIWPSFVTLKYTLGSDLCTSYNAIVVLICCVIFYLYRMAWVTFICDYPPDNLVLCTNKLIVSKAAIGIYLNFEAPLQFFLLKNIRWQQCNTTKIIGYMRNSKACQLLTNISQAHEPLWL